jgi:hypothetical protein
MTLMRLIFAVGFWISLFSLLLDSTLMTLIRLIFAVGFCEKICVDLLNLRHLRSITLERQKSNPNQNSITEARPSGFY